MTDPIEVAVVGSVNADLSVRVARHPLPGETLLGSGGVVTAGGKGANQAVAAALQGASVAMVGAVGGEGLGDLGIRYGYQRFMPDVMLAVVVILIVLVQLVQSIGEWIAARFDKRAPRNRGH